jgi:hypothetical protein
MTQKNQAKHRSNCQITAQTIITATDESSLNVHLKKRKAEAKKTLYLNRV